MNRFRIFLEKYKGVIGLFLTFIVFPTSGWFMSVHDRLNAAEFDNRKLSSEAHELRTQVNALQVEAKETTRTLGRMEGKLDVLLRRNHGR